MQPALFQRLLGARFYGLPPAARGLLAGPLPMRHAGSASVQGARNPLARAVAWLARLPAQASDHPLVVTVVADGGQGERWIGMLGRFAFDLKLGVEGRRLRLRRSGLRLRLVLHVHESRLWAHVAQARWFGLPMPPLLVSGVQLQLGDVVGDGAAPRSRFRLEVVLPLAGRVVGIDGWLSRRDDGNQDPVHPDSL